MNSTKPSMRAAVRVQVMGMVVTGWLAPFSAFAQEPGQLSVNLVDAECLKSFRVDIASVASIDGMSVRCGRLEDARFRTYLVLADWHKDIAKRNAEIANLRSKIAQANLNQYALEKMGRLRWAQATALASAAWCTKGQHKKCLTALFALFSHEEQLQVIEDPAAKVAEVTELQRKLTAAVAALPPDPSGKISDAVKVFNYICHEVRRQCTPGEARPEPPTDLVVQ